MSRFSAIKNFHEHWRPVVDSLASSKTTEPNTHDASGSAKIWTDSFPDWYAGEKANAWKWMFWLVGRTQNASRSIECACCAWRGLGIKAQALSALFQSSYTRCPHGLFQKDTSRYAMSFLSKQSPLPAMASSRTYQTPRIVLSWLESWWQEFKGAKQSSHGVEKTSEPGYALRVSRGVSNFAYQSLICVLLGTETRYKNPTVSEYFSTCICLQPSFDKSVVTKSICPAPEKCLKTEL